MNANKTSESGLAPRETVHVSERWTERTAKTDIDVARAWQEGIPVSAPECRCDEARLYPPQDALVLRRGSAMVTVLWAEYHRLDAPALVRCNQCECVTTLSRSPRECEWCETPLTGDRADGRVQISRA